MDAKNDFIPYLFVGGKKVEFSSSGIRAFLEDESNSLELMLRNLSNIARYNGATVLPWTVLMHSLLCLELAKEFCEEPEPYLFKSALCHDLAEAFVGDITRPIKSLCGNSLQDFEKVVERDINCAFEIKFDASYPEVKRFDYLAAKFEMLYFFGEDTLTEEDKVIELDTIFEYMHILQETKAAKLIKVFIAEFDSCW